MLEDSFDKFLRGCLQKGEIQSYLLRNHSKVELVPLDDVVVFLLRDPFYDLGN